MDLEAGETREGVVQKALDEIGEETAGILQRAHATADEIAARSRTQADSRLQRAQREAEIARREADEYSEQVVVDTRALWEDRQRLIEEYPPARRRGARHRRRRHGALGSMPEPLARQDEPTTSEDEVAGPIGLAPAEVDDRAATQIFEFDPSDEPSDDDEGFAPADPDDDEATEAYRLEPVADEEPRGDESGGTVELEALPGGEPDDEPATPRRRSSPRAALLDPSYRGILPRPLRPVAALLLVALREVPKDFENRRPMIPGALPPAR